MILLNCNKWHVLNHGLVSFGWSSLVWSGLYGLFIGLVSIFLFFTISFLYLINHNVTY